MKKYVLMIGGTLVVGMLMLLGLGIWSGPKEQNFEQIEYRTDRAPIESRLENLPHFGKCFWKSGVIGNTTFGPTNYWMKGFLILDREDLNTLIESYEWKEAEVSFPQGVEPDITGYQDFVWCSNRTYEEFILNQKFVGYIFLDRVHGVLYFDIENS